MRDQKIYVNGRFLTRNMTGVDRVAREVCLRFSRRFADRLCLLVTDEKYIEGPSEQAFLKTMAENGTEIRHVGSRNGHLWEQFDLPLFQKHCQGPRPLLVNFCNSAPLFWKNSAVMIHDAQVWDVPETVNWKFRLFYRALLPRIAARSKCLMTVSAYSRARLEHHGVFPSGKANVVYNGVDHIDNLVANPDTLTKFNLEKNNYFLVIGSVAPHKNLEFLKRAAADRPAGSPQLVIAGGFTTQVFTGAGLSDQDGVQFVGRVSDAELKSLYSNALALTFPSLTEGFGLPPLEAMRCGCPVIATTGGAVPEVLGDAAIYASPTDQKAWSDAMQTIANDSKLRLSLAEKGTAQSQAFTWDIAADQMAEVLQ